MNENSVKIFDTLMGAIATAAILLAGMIALAHCETMSKCTAMCEDGVEEVAPLSCKCK